MVTDSELSESSPTQPSRTREKYTETSPNKRLRPRSQNLSPPSDCNKGKSKLQERDEDSNESNCCGICLSDEGTAIRGWIDSCDHYFCYLCIMEWAKVESKCPLCKRRFTTIHRPPKPGVFLSERIVNVPVRDQVYHHYGNATVGPPDLFSEVQCSKCHKTTDESLLLLCDLCDSAAHTYCVGLGATVPEDDWFCQDCSVLRAEHIKSEMDTTSDSPAGFQKFCKMPSTESGASIFDIVRESISTELLRPPTTFTLRSGQFSSSVAPDSRNSSVDDVTKQVSERGLITTYNVSELGARTLQRCRNVHDRIRVLRENWNAFRCGSLNFSSKSGRCDNVADQKHNIGAMFCGSPSESHSASCSSQPLIAQKDSSCNVVLNRSLHDIDKAWKMMEAAKALKGGRGRISMNEPSKHLPRIVTGTKGADSMSTRLPSSNREHPRTRDLGRTVPEKKYQYYSPVQDRDTHELWMFKKQKQCRVTSRGVPNVCQAFPDSQSTRKAQTSQNVDASVKIAENLSQTNILGSTSDAFSGPDRPACFISSVLPTSMASCKNHSELECQASSSNKMASSSGNRNMEENCMNSKAKKDYDAKTEIQALVKLNLKLLSKGKELEVHEFKKVARLATHSVLAACGLEQLRPGVRSFPSSVCHHADEARQLRRSTLMPSSCRECFYVFVKDVVSSTMFEKIGHF